MPRVRDPAELNDHLRRCCLQARDRTPGADTQTVAARLGHDPAAAGPRPARPFDACVVHPGQVDNYQTVAFDTDRYSVPRRDAFGGVTVRGLIDRIEVVADHRVIAGHTRSYATHERVLDPLHFLVTLGQKPAPLGHAPVYRDWALPPAFTALRTELERRLGARPGVRQYIAVPQLLARFPLGRVARAVAHHPARGEPTAAAVTTTTERLAATGDLDPPSSDTRLSHIAGPHPDLARFDRLVPRSTEGDCRDRPGRAAAEGRPRAVETADDAGRVREAGP